VATASASGKIILFGEHAVVYGRPALAVPISTLRAHARVEPSTATGVTIHAPDLGRTFPLDLAPADDPLAAVTRSALVRFLAPPDLALDLWVESELPIASGLGSGAAVSTAIVRALAAFFGRTVTPEETSEMVFETEKLYHGTPSGIDNSVIAFERAIRYTQQDGPRAFQVARPFTLAIADTGIRSPTRLTVGDVRRAWETDRSISEHLFDQIGQIVAEAELALANGDVAELGPLMDQNQLLLQAIGVSSKENELLLQVGRQAGAQGGKLSGGGRGGNVILAVDEERVDPVRTALFAAGAANVIVTRIG
jgi:mevalonate kinase